MFNIKCCYFTIKTYIFIPSAVSLQTILLCFVSSKTHIFFTLSPFRLTSSMSCIYKSRSERTDFDQILQSGGGHENCMIRGGRYSLVMLFPGEVTAMCY